MNRSQKLAAMLMLALGVVGCSATPEATEPAPQAVSHLSRPVAQPLTLNEHVDTWRAQHAEVFTVLGAAVTRLATAINHGDMAGLHAVCRDLTTIDQRLRDTLPAPDPSLTTALSEMAGHVADLTSHCPTLNFTSSSAEFSRFGSDFTDASRAFQEAQNIMDDSDDVH